MIADACDSALLYGINVSKLQCYQTHPLHTGGSIARPISSALATVARMDSLSNTLCLTHSGDLGLGIKCTSSVGSRGSRAVSLRGGTTSLVGGGKGRGQHARADRGAAEAAAAAAGRTHCVISPWSCCRPATPAPPPAHRRSWPNSFGFACSTTNGLDLSKSEQNRGKPSWCRRAARNGRQLTMSGPGSREDSMCQQSVKISAS